MANAAPARPSRHEHVVDRVPAAVFFVTSATFHYLGPAFAVLLFMSIDVLGVAWLRIATAALIFAVWRRPWQVWTSSSWEQRRLLIALGLVLGAMNCVFYLAIDRLPLGTVGAIEFLGPIVLAVIGIRSLRNVAALVLAVAGVYLLADVHFVDEPVGLMLAGINCVLFAAYIVLGHRLAENGGASGVDRLGAAMLIAMIVVAPLGFSDALETFMSPLLLAAGIGVGICSSVIPYVCDQLAMARIPRATFALMLSLLPATATVIGLIVLHQVPSWLEVAGVVLIVAGIVAHEQKSAG